MFNNHQKNISKKRANSFFRYFMPCFIIAIISISSLTLFTTNYVFNSLTQVLFFSNQNYLNYTTQTVHSNLLPLISMEQKQYLDKVFFGWDLKGDTTQALATQDLLHSMVNNDPLLLDIIYQSEKNEYCITSKSTAKSTELFKTMYKFIDFDITELDEDECFSSSTVYVQYVDSKPLPVVVYKMNISATETVYLLIDSEKLLSFMDDAELSSDISYILDGDKNLLFCSDAILKETYTPEDFVPIDNEFSITSFENSEYVRSSTYSPELDWYFIKLNPTAQVLGIISTLQLNLFFVFIATLVVCIFFSLYFAQRNYTPIKKLQKRIETILPLEDINTNDFEYINNAVQILNSKKDYLQSTLDDYKVDGKQTFLLKNFYGSFNNESHAKKMASAFSLELKNSFYTVAFLSGFKSLDSIDTIINTLKTHCFPQIALFDCVVKSKKVIFIAVGLDFDDYDLVHTYFNVVLKKLKSANIKNCTIGLGNTVSSFIDWNQSLVEAEKAYSYYTLLGKERCITFYDIKTQKNSNHIEVPEEALTNALLSADILEFNKIKDAFEIELQQAKPPKEQLQIYSFLLIRSLTNAINELNKNIFAFDPIPTYHLSRIKTDTMLEMLNIYTIMSNELIDEIIKKRNNNMLVFICDKMNENISNCDFSAVNLADELKLSPSQLSRYFKQHFDKSFIEHLTSLRIDKAKSLLKNTGLSVSDISSQVGYSSVNSFCRRFKQVTGTTPLNYKNFPLD